MLFTTFDPYYDDVIKYKKINNYNTEECFICYQFTIENKTEPLKLNQQLFYVKKCNCDGSIHEKCLKKWFDMYKTCPICRNTMTKNNYIIIQNEYQEYDEQNAYDNNDFNDNDFNVLHEYILSNYIIRAKNILTVFFFIYITSEIYKSVNL